MSDEDIVVIAHSVKTGWGNLNSQRTYGSVNTANRYYLFSYNSDNSITIKMELDLATERALISIFEEAINDKTAGENKFESISRWISSIRSGQSGLSFDYGDDGRGNAKDKGTNILDDKPSVSDAERDIQLRTEDIGGKASRELDLDYDENIEVDRSRCTGRG